ncbi:hypothetical protein [Pseudolactococcus reticulitermitis]|uniref:Uncharacterized protein n=1 Tax=Pseudolactococcus reticulitermitis TaxID=2025039 RepID=A0A224XDJ2_9LACT|nr:hypothetical protein [Lactococcus reticulitermitis]GAX47673.1 hypothetical protein RsY01_1274 [Lactococcus reticulitermitis]
MTLLENTISEPFSINFEQHNQNSAHISVPARLYNKANSNFYGLVHEELRDIKTDEPVFGILTKIVIENVGSSQDEVAKFSKNERYYRLLMKMIELDSSNPRWFAHLSPYAIQALIQESKYEPLLIKYLFKNQEVLIEKDAILISPYTSNLFERYITLLYTKNEFEAAKKVAEFALTMYPENSSLMFNSALAEIGKIQLDIKRAMKTTLGRYLVLNKQDAYENNLCDTQSLKLALAELNSMNGNYQIAEQIISDIKDENLLNIWELWHPIQN